MPHLTKRYRLVVLWGLVSVLALVLIGRWLNATKRGGQGFIDPDGYRAYIDTAERDFRSGRVH